MEYGGHRRQLIVEKGGQRRRNMKMRRKREKDEGEGERFNCFK